MPRTAIMLRRIQERGKGTLLIYPRLWIIWRGRRKLDPAVSMPCPEPRDHAQEDTPITSSIGGTTGDGVS